MRKSKLRNAILAVAHGLSELSDSGEIDLSQTMEDAKALGRAWLDFLKDTPEGAEEAARIMAECPNERVRKAALGEFSYSTFKLGAPYVALNIMASRALQDGSPPESFSVIGAALLGLQSSGAMRKIALDLMIAFGNGGDPKLPKPLVPFPRDLLNDLRLLQGTGEIPDCLPEEL
jgi:hypothetical protein